jgi:hypothetical protein
VVEQPVKIALCTTTIHIPHTLKLMRKCSPDVRFFVATDDKTPTRQLGTLHVDNSLCMRGENWKCSEAIGWNTLARRNIAFLEALKWGADVIYSWDNDNIPVDLKHFDLIDSALEFPFNGIQMSGTNGWFDPGMLLQPQVRHRGFPHDKCRTRHASSVNDLKVGVAAGLVLGDPDIDATTRMELRPDISQAHLLGQTGVVVDPHTWTVFNSQNTAVIRELIPAWFMMPGVGRHDDIYASLIVQRVARERGYAIHFGPPFTYQQRNAHNLVADLRAEVDGMEHVAHLADILEKLCLTGRSVVADVRLIYELLEHVPWVPGDAIWAAYKWLEDCEAVL